MQKQYLIADEIDFIMEDLEITEEEALAHYEKRKARAGTIGTPTNLRQIAETIFREENDGDREPI
jgi:hypothetical protein